MSVPEDLLAILCRWFSYCVLPSGLLWKFTLDNGLKEEKLEYVLELTVDSHIQLCLFVPLITVFNMLTVLLPRESNPDSEICRGSSPTTQ
jgi:hypothetical protein